MAGHVPSHRAQITVGTADPITQFPAERGIPEVTLAEHEPGMCMFRAHQAEFTELGWTAMIDIVEAEVCATPLRRHAASAA
ncbi:hypothetical protein [Defluviimonas salinarum]|uniref:Uncharacterized protein n=1 Tax=Defluviimonas salinarum TaxID=2992147 RepID=A0ABT3J9N5_9RHOB|nr:hypothetical protein [Defluviimonas salinarum]MCW3784409.1 hypothetical protein [Defluviimonas salinarum]